MLDKYENDQQVIIKLLKESLNNNKLVQAYLFSCDDLQYAYEFAKDFIKEIIGKSNQNKEVLENIFSRIDNDEYTELKVISPDGNYIKKEQLIDLQISVKNKPVEANKIFYIIKSCDKLNSSSANSILKFLEEPYDDVIAILITDNLNMVIPTIKSRCQILSFKNIKNNYDSFEKLKKYLDISEELNDEELSKLIENSINFLEEIERKKINALIYEKSLLWDNFKITGDILVFLNILIYCYTDALNIKISRNLNYMYDYTDKIEQIKNNNTEDQLIRKINIIEEIKKQLLLNVNSKLLFDKLIIELSEV